MKQIDDIRRDNMARLRDELGGVIGLSRRLDRSEPQISQWINGSLHSVTGKPRGMKAATARWIEVMVGKPEGWLDQDHSSETIKTLTHALAQQIEAASPEVQGAIMALLMSYQTDQARGDDTARAIKTLLGIRNGDTRAG